MTPLEIAMGFLARGWNPVPVAYRGKKPIGLEWQKRRISEENVAEHFGSEPMNVGIQLGKASGVLTDVDLDFPEAAGVAPRLLPRTPCIFGRASNRASHRLYFTTLCEQLDKATIQFKDPTPKAELPPGVKSMLLELRIGGGEQGAQTVAPGSVHVSGEPVEFEPGCDGEPAKIDGDHLLTCLRQTAAATLAARYWPPETSRHDGRLAVTGLLARAGIEQARAFQIIEAIAVAAGDSKINDARSDVTSTYKQLAEGRPITGIKRAREVFGDRVANRIAEWLGAPLGPESSTAGGNFEASVDRLAKLSPCDYDRGRVSEARRLGVRVRRSRFRSGEAPSEGRRRRPRTAADAAGARAMARSG